jgi:hypothetical protein
MVTVIGRGGTGGSGGGGTLTGGGGSTGAGGTGTVTPTAGRATVEAIGGGGGEDSWVGSGTFLGAVGWTKRLTRVAGPALRRFSWRTLAVSRRGCALPAAALFCPADPSGAFA